jgi:hypothetical protein
MANPKELEAVLENIRNPHNWANSETIFQAIRDNPSLRGFVYGYVSEMEFEHHYLKRGKGIESVLKDDDHKRTKSDRTVIFKGRPVSIQVKSVQTNSIRFVEGSLVAKVQNDASDRRSVTLPNGAKLEATCYKVGEYDILAVSLHAFTSKWRFAFKENSKLQRSTSKKYAAKDQQCLLATLETIRFPLDPTWTDDFEAILEKVSQQKH